MTGGDGDSTVQCMGMRMDHPMGLGRHITLFALRDQTKNHKTQGILPRELPDGTV